MSCKSLSSYNLKPCPFCGNTDVHIVWDCDEGEFLGVKCFNCGGCIDTEKNSAEEAVEAWNKRTI